jgi:hypothetical protein
MGRATGFNTDKTLGHLGEEGQHIPAPQRPGHNHAACRVDTMNRKDVLGQIKADGRDRRQIGDRLCHGRRSFKRLLNDNHLGTALH